MLLLFLLHVIHNLFCVFVAFGFLLPKKYLIYYVFCWPIMLLCWKTNNDTCFLTEWEKQLNRDYTKQSVYEKWSSILHMSPAHVEWFFICSITLLWLIAMIRLFW